MTDLPALHARGAAQLKESMVASGGWGYRIGGQLFVEPTAWGLLALAPAEPAREPVSLEGDHEIARSLAVLLSCQKPEGYFGTSLEDHEPSWTTAPAILALQAHGHRSNAEKAARWLASWKAPGQRPSDEFVAEMTKLLKIDYTIPGWPWLGDTFATVEPTALGCLAMRSLRLGTDRIEDAVRYLHDRACSVGGWNYGNPHFFQADLPPICLPTAKGLLALILCDPVRRSPLVKRSLETFSHLLEGNPSRKAHAWAGLVFAAAGDQDRALAEARQAVDSGDGAGEFSGGPNVTALALLSLRAASGAAPQCLSKSAA